MTGAAQLAYVHEPGYMEGPTDTTYKRFGLEPTMEDISFENALSRMGLPTDPQTVKTVAQLFEGAVSVSFVPTGEPWYHTELFGVSPEAGGEAEAPYSYTWTPKLGRHNSGRLYAGVDYLDGTAERELMGVCWGQLQTQFSIGEDVRQTLTGFYGNETPNASLTPSSLPEPAGDPLVFHGATVTVDASTLAKIQSATLDISTGARPQRGLSRFPVDAVSGRTETTLSPSKIITDTAQRDLAYGGSTGPTDDVAGAPTGQLKFATPGANSLAYDLVRLTPQSYSWSELLNREEDTLEDVTYYADEVSVTAESASDTAK